MAASDDIKARLDIVDVVGAYVKLTKSGRNYKGLSPFQNERTPSFYVFPESQTFKDFSSGEQGDIFGFVMKKEGWTFPEALRELAHRAGVQLEERTPDQQRSQDHDARLRDACAQAAVYFHQLLLTSPQAEACRGYIRDKRSLRDETVVAWQMGYSLADYQALSVHMAARGFSAQELIDAGLVIQNDEGRRYDRFRGRLMIPICDEKGRVVGFGSRSLDGSEPKYMNSPQTAIFDKGRLLFGLDRSRATIRNLQQSVIVEGYMDVIGTHQAGFTNVVAGMGTSLTEDQFKALKKISEKIVLALDGDAAGNRAVLRGVNVARETLDRDSEVVLDGRGLIRHESKLKADIRVALLPDGKDPDEVVLEAPALWQEIIAGARPVVEHVIAITLASMDLDDPRAKSVAIAAVAPILNDLTDPIQRDIYVQQLARRLQLNTRSITQALGLAAPLKIRPEASPPAAHAASGPAEPGSGLPGVSSRATPSQVRGSHLDVHLLAVLARYPELLKDVNSTFILASMPALSEADFIHPALQQGFAQLRRAALGQTPPEGQGEEWLAMIAEHALTSDDEFALREEAVRTALRLRDEGLDREHKALSFLIQEKDRDRADGVESGEAVADDGLYNAKIKLHQVTVQRLRAQKALKLRSALTVN